MQNFLVCKIVGSSWGLSKASKFPPLLLLSFSMITSPISNIMATNRANKRAHKKQVKRDEWKRGEEKAKVFENRFRSGGEENERQMANNVMQDMRVLWWLLGMSWLGVDLPNNDARNSSCYFLSLRWFSLEEERVMQQSSASISLSFENQGINPVGDYMQVA